MALGHFCAHVHAELDYRSELNLVTLLFRQHSVTTEPEAEHVWITGAQRLFSHLTKRPHKPPVVTCTGPNYVRSFQLWIQDV